MQRSTGDRILETHIRTRATRIGQAHPVRILSALFSGGVSSDGLSTEAEGSGTTRKTTNKSGPESLAR